MYIYVFLDENDCPYYVGQTNNLKERFWDHKHCMAKGKKNYRYNKARKLESKGHPLELVVIDTAETREELSELEIYYIAKFRSLGIKLCNVTDGGDLPPSRKGVKFSKEHRKNISKAKKGIKPSFSEEQRRKISVATSGKNHWSYNKKFSGDHKKKLSIARRRRVITDETRKKTSNTSTGRINIKQFNLISPEGKEFTTVSGLSYFCREHNLQRKYLYAVLRGEIDNWRGWKICRL